MLMADDTSNDWFFNDLLDGDDGGDEMCIDLNSLLGLLNETPDASQLRTEETSLNDAPQGLLMAEGTCSIGEELPESFAFSPSYNSEASDSRTGASDVSYEYVGNSANVDCANAEPSAQSGSNVANSSASLVDWMLPIYGHNFFYADRDNVFLNTPSSRQDDNKEMQSEILNCSATFSFPAANANHVSDLETEDFNHQKGDSELQSSCSEKDARNQCVLENCVLKEDELIININSEGEELSNHNACLDRAMIFETQGVGIRGAVSEALMNCNSDLEKPNCFHIGGNLVPSMSGYASDHISNWITHHETLEDPHCSMLNIANEEVDLHVVNGTSDQLVVSQGTMPQSCEVFDNAVARNSFGDWLPIIKGSTQPVPGIMDSCSTKGPVGYVKDESRERHLVLNRICNSVDILREKASRISTTGVDNHCFDIQALKKPSVVTPSTSTGKQLVPTKRERETKLIQITSMGSNLSKFNQTIKNKSFIHVPDDGDDSDICILEDSSVHAYQNMSSVNGKTLLTSHRSTFSGPVNNMLGGVRLKHDERFIFQAALQDLSQPKSEATPPVGVLAVPLLRHQRIALSWMVHKETASLHCSGGILADDQGLGKTISTIALILKERSPSSGACDNGAKQNGFETLDLDEDDDGVTEPGRSNRGTESFAATLQDSPIKGGKSSVKVKGRPAAGTLIVCPTSVLRQWSEELQEKVTSQANLSVLIYHGSNRTKDHIELAKYDVVLTTYSIVSMEVPRKTIVGVDDDEIVKGNDVPTMALSLNKKRKYPPSSDKRSLKGKKGMDSDLLESAARPLAKVGWFRVVLDEAQSIKNHRTQVARACWGLRAKRRWCLSGTPIQNAVDDLYSYFRFLRYDPYAVYKTFCSTLKVPIHKNPTNGYKKLQAVLKTVMLRRTKGSLLDGQPIISLPPKTVKLKKVDFTDEERDFYCRLEAESRAQFAEYAAAGTVKQNYVNILLMLLRLRQACDHPLLVRGVDSNLWRSSVEMARKLPWEKRSFLLNCLEASLAICGICNDSPEDAVCTSCGHVFCNQCICEHLSGDDNQCPSTDCKTRLNVSSLFSKSTLRSSLHDQPGQENILDCSGSGFAEPCSSGLSFDSSKIKAALEVLKSLSKPVECTSSASSLNSINEPANYLKNSFNPPYGIEGDLRENRNLNPSTCSNQLVSRIGEKAIVFSQWTRMLDLLEACLKNSSIQYRRLDGTMTVVARDKAVKDFNTLPEVSVMIMSLKAASLGLNMVAACHVLLLDLWWNPTTEDQAIDRAHRIGQTRPVTVLRLTVKDTVEDRILALQQKKREMVASAFGEDETGSRQTRLTVEDLKYLFMA